MMQCFVKTYKKMLGSSTTLEKCRLQVHTCSSVCFRDIEFLLVFDLKITKKNVQF